jgi:subfamily B ATP-binding cassette protein MsbA
MNIITGLLKINSGEITIDGASLYSYNLNSFRSKIGYINQETVIFNDTLFNNITLWDKLNKTNLNRFNELLKDCHIYEFLRDAKKKHEFQISNFGNNLSGGQKQRIALARELYKNPEILIMDEALSALDSKTEKIILEKIKSLTGKLTIIVISHSLNVTKYCDLTYCIHNSKVIEKRK